MNKTNYRYLIAAPLLLAGCNTPHIIENYDEFKKEKICRLDPYLIRSEVSFGTNRQTFLSLERAPNNMIKAFLTSNTINGLLGTYDGFSASSKIKFQVTNAAGHVDEFIMQGEHVPTTYGSQTVYGAYGISYDVGTKSSAVAFNITEKQLQDIASAQKVMLTVDSGKDPLKVELNGSDKKAIDLFLNKCSKGLGK